MRFAAVLLIVAAFMAPELGSAQVFKCKGPGGKIVYGDAPCEDGAAGTVVNTTANVLESDSTRSAARGDFDEPRMAKPQARNYPAPPIQTIQAVRPVDQMACRNAKRDLDSARSSMNLEISRGKHPGPTLSAVKSAELAVDSACNTNMAAARGRTEPTHASPQPKPPAPPPETPGLVVNCDQAGCWDTNGHRLNNAAGGNFHRSDGKFCTRAGPNVICN
jgi:hypothetical protein